MSAIGTCFVLVLFKIDIGLAVVILWSWFWIFARYKSLTNLVSFVFA